MAQFKKYLLACSLLLILLPRQGKTQGEAQGATQGKTQNRTPGSPQASGPGQTQASAQGTPQASALVQGSSQPSAPARDQSPTPAAPAKDTLPADTSIQTAFALLDSLFRRPEFLYETLGPDIPADMQPVLIRFNNAIAANRDWFMEYRSKFPNQPLPYDEHFGITAEEYRRIRRLEAAPPALVPIDSQMVSVLKDGAFIHFKSNGEDRLLDYLYIDPTHRLLEYGGDTIPFAGPASAGRNSPYGQWQGFAWRLERIQQLPTTPTDPLDPQKTPDPGSITARIVEVNIGTPADGSRKTFIRIQYQNLQAGIATANMELLGFIH